MQKLLTLAQAAELLNCSRPTVSRLTRQGAIASLRKGRLVRVSEESLERWIRQNTVGGVPAARERRV